jgi:hypothetical protein
MSVLGVRIVRWWTRASAPVRVGTLDGLILLVGTVVAYVGDSLHILQGHGQWLDLVALAAMSAVFMSQLAPRRGSKR